MLFGCGDRGGNSGRVTQEPNQSGDESVAQRDGQGANESANEAVGLSMVTAEIWVDNWFSLTVKGKPAVEDSVPFKTERSFNAERVRFSAEFPMTLAFTFRDFVENDTGLEYIGSRRQQVGDGGAIAQFTNGKTGEIIKVTDSSWRCKVVHRAPIDAACAKEQTPKVGEGSCRAQILQAPDGWTNRDFDDKTWDFATEYSADQVRPKGGYDGIKWRSEAKLIWSKDLELDNTVLCRAVASRVSWAR